MELRSNFSFGSTTAEDDYLLSSAYFDNGDFTALISEEDPRCFLIGRTGSGKSAALEQLEKKFPNKVLRVIPENLSFPYITNMTVTRELLSIGVHLEPFFKALWKHVIVVEVLKKRYGLTTEAQKLHILDQLKEKLMRDKSKVRALEYLDEFGDKFWCETDERVKQIAESFETRIKSAGGGKVQPSGIGLEVSGDKETAKTITTTTELANRYQRIVNQAQLPRLNEMVTILNNSILESRQNFTDITILSSILTQLATYLLTKLKNILDIQLQKRHLKLGDKNYLICYGILI